jgi:hypothetical protein
MPFPPAFGPSLCIRSDSSLDSATICASFAGCDIEPTRDREQMTRTTSTVRQGVAASVLGLILFFGVCGAAEFLARLLIADRPEWETERSALDDTLDLADLRCREEGPTGARRRVLVVGESTGEQIGSAIAAQVDPDTSVLNCARSAVSIELVERAFDRAWETRPDALVILFGHNYRFAYATPDWRLRLRRWRTRSRLLTALTAQLDATGFDPQLGRMLGAATSRVDATAASLTRMMAAARARDVPVVITTMSANRLAPSAAFPEAPAHASVLASRWHRFSGQPEYGEALLDVADGDPSAAVLRYERGTWALREGRIDAARVDLAAAVVLDPQVGRATEALNDTVRETARSGGALVRDSAVAVATSAPRELAGWSTHVDHCHLTQAHAEINTNA